MNSNEDAPYQKEPWCHYIKTKIEAEKLAIAANGRKGLKVGIIRPSGEVYGPRDQVLKIFKNFC